MRNKSKMSAAKWLTGLALFAALVALAVPPRAAAQDDSQDPPGRAARLSYTGGSVSFAPAGSDEWANAVVNRPMTTGDKLWTDRGGRAELRVDSYAIRLGEQTGFSFLNLDDRTVQIRLTEGTVNVRVRRIDESQVLEVDTPNLAFNVLRPGSYRINVNEDGDTTIVNVRDGQGEVTGGGSAYPIHAGQSATFQGSDQLIADVEGYPGDDDFDRWCGDRDARWDRSTAPRYVSDDVVGYEDLDDYGGWRPVPEYGTVWFPHTTIVGWAPYRYGHWVWVSPWGWTWVDDAPWGFAPFHYGRWVVVGGVWGWVPVAPRPAVVTVGYVRPVYAPALVAWVGGPHFGVGVAVGGVAAGVAWFPLGPRDVFCPAYRVGPRYVENVNVYNTTIINRTQVTNIYTNVYVNRNVTNITYQNQRVANAVTATSRASFTSAQPIGRNMIRVDSKEVASAPGAPLTPAVAPQQRSFLGAGGAARVTPPANISARAVVAKNTPPPPAAPIARQMQAVEGNNGRPVAASEFRQSQTNLSSVRMAQQARPAPLPTGGQHVNTSTERPGGGSSSDHPANARTYNDRPPASRPSTNSELQQRHQQQLDSLRQQQDQQRQKLEQKQVQENQKLQQQNANQQRQEQTQQRQQQQLQQMEQKHDEQQQKLQQHQQQEAQKPQKESKPPKDSKDHR